MSPAEFQQELQWAGWKALACRVFNFRPAEIHALGLLVRSPGRVVQVHAFAAFAGEGANSRCWSERPTPNALAKRIERVRAKLDDCGCGGLIQTIAAEGSCRTTGYRLRDGALEEIDEVLRSALGVIAEGDA